MANHPERLLRGMDCWPNHQPERYIEELLDAREHGISPISPEDPAFEAFMRTTTRFNWAVLLDGEGKVPAFLSNTTGHYKNEPFVVPPVKRAFEVLGIFFER